MNDFCIIMNKFADWLVNGVLVRTAPHKPVYYSGVAHDTDFQSMRVRKHKDGALYMCGKPLKYDDVSYTDASSYFPEIPEGRYLYLYRHPLISMDLRLDDYKEAVAMPYDDIMSYLAIMSYLKMTGNDASRKIRCLEINGTDDTEAKMLKYLEDPDSLPYFETRFYEAFQERARVNFESTFPISRNFFYLQLEAGMSNKDMAAYFGTSVRNIENWRKDPSSLSDMVYDLMEYKLLNEGII